MVCNISSSISPATVGGGGSVERQQSPGSGIGVFSLGVSFANRHDDLGNQGEILRLSAARTQTLAHRGHRVVLQEPLRTERHHQQAVGMFSSGSSQLRAKRADIDRRWAVGVRTGVEGRRHQCVPIVVAPKVQPATGITGVPGRKDRAQRGNQLGHAGHRIVELRPEPLLDLRADLSAKSEDEPATGKQLVVVGLMRQMYRVAGKRDGHIRHQVQAAHRSGQCERSEYVVRSLEGGYAAGAGIAQVSSAFGRVGGAV